MTLNQQLEAVNTEAEGHNESLQAAMAAKREIEVERDNLSEQVRQRNTEMSESQTPCCLTFLLNAIP